MNPRYSDFRRPQGELPVATLAALIGGAVLVIVLILAAARSTTVVEPGHRGVRVTLGRVSPVFEQEGFLVKAPFITQIHQVSIRQQTVELKTECYSADLQQVRASVRILFRIPEASVVTLFRDYSGDPLAALVAPRVVEALKEVASTQSAEMIVQNRETIKMEALAATRRKIGELPGGGPLIVIEDLTLSDLALSAELNTAIEQKMTQREEAERAKFVQRQAEIEAETAIIKGRGEAEAIAIRGRALRENPAFIRLQIVEKWDGTSPLVVGGEGATSPVMIPLGDLDNRK
ncbi:MAG: prohibitin family protein [Verrucomicrobiae bacterium]|nr:prohibitin family protein [Verrucomicrobiae bacterium]